MLQFYHPRAPETAIHLFEFTGNDAANFLHRISSVDIKRLQNGSGSPAFFLSAAGKIVSYFYLWRKDENAFLIELEDDVTGEWEKKFLGTLDHYHFSEDIKIKKLDDYQPTWLFSESALNLQGRESEFIFSHPIEKYGRHFYSIWRKNKETTLSKEASPASFDEIEYWRIQSLWPRVGYEISFDSNPFDVGFRDFFVTPKGCFPGQEVIEKMLTRGTAAKKFCIVDRPKNAQIGSAVFGTEDLKAEIGKIGQQKKDLALAVLRKTHAEAGTHIFTATGERILVHKCKS